jgi:hypothetical protein
MIHRFIDQTGNTYGICFLEGHCVRFYCENRWLGDRKVAGGKVLWVESDWILQPDVRLYVERLAKLTAFL